MHIVKSYSFSFTAASIRPEMASAVAEHFLRTGSWEDTKQAVLSENALQSRSPASAIRMEREIRHRLKTLTGEQLQMLPRATSDVRMAIGWLAAVKHSAFLHDFVSECLRTKLAQQDTTLRLSDYERFIEEKSPLQPELGQLALSTSAKIRRVLVLMLKEVGILESGPDLGQICRPVLSPDVSSAIIHDDPRWLAVFLVPDDEIQRLGGPSS